MRIRKWMGLVFLGLGGFACEDGFEPAPSVHDDNEQGSVDPAFNETERSAAGARKAAGGLNGDGDYCDSGGCTDGEGDCDNVGQCAPGLTCVFDSGGRFAAYVGPAASTAFPRNHQQDDHCMNPLCNDRIPGNAPGETGTDCGGVCGNCDPAVVPVPGGTFACELPQHHSGRCTYHCQCQLTGGDCDADDNCIGWQGTGPGDPNRAVCLADSGNRVGGPAASDYCFPAHCRDRVQNFDETGIDSGGSCGTPNCAAAVPGSECTPSCPCAAGQGDCDSNLDCRAGLVCVEAGAVDVCQRGAAELIGHWDFEEGAGSVARNVGGNPSLDGFISGATFVPGRVGRYALSFNGSSNYVQIANQAALVPATLGITLWFKPRAAQVTWADILDKGHGSGSNPYFAGYVLQYAGNASSFDAAYGNGSAFVGVSSGGNYKDDQWHHLAVNLGQTEVALYIDGVLIASTASGGPLVQNDADLFFGRHRALGRYFNGLIDDVQFYDGALTANEVSSIYATGGR